MTPNLSGRRVLVVEDEFLLADDLARALRSEGAEVIGPVANIDNALDLLEENESVDGAVIDINLQGEKAYPVAEALISRAVPFLFATGYDAASIPAQFAKVPVCEKPVDASKVLRILLR